MHILILTWHIYISILLIYLLHHIIIKCYCVYFHSYCYTGCEL